MNNQQPKLRGFAAMKKNNPERFLELMRLGGSSVPKEKRSFSKDRDLAVEAGRAGGRAGGRASSGGGRPKK